MFGFKKRRRKRLMEQSFPEDGLEILHANVPYYRYLPPDRQRKLQGLINIFLDEKQFEGCAGLEVNREMEVTIAAQACILMLGLDDLSSFYPELRSVLVYPHTYVAKIQRRQNSFFVEEGFQQRRGESWSRGHVVLAWDEVQRGASDIHDGDNLVFHEFAHQLDYEYGATSRIDSEEGESTYYSWARTLSREYEKFLAALERNQKTMIDEYGATSLAEFFAVCTEYFFEKPKAFRQKHPALYQQLTEFYRQDPAAYMKS